MRCNLWIGVVQVHRILDRQVLAEGVVESPQVFQDHTPLVGGDSLLLGIHILLDDPANHLNAFVLGLVLVEGGNCKEASGQLSH